MNESHACAGHLPVAPPVPIDDAARAREQRRRDAGLLVNVVDVHTHLFPDGIYRALERWFDAHAWHIEFRGRADEVVDELRRSGVRQLVALLYAHKPGLAEPLNAFLAELCRRTPGVIGVGTVLPGEPDAERITREAITRHGMRGIKLHCHVMGLPIDDERVMAVLAQCQEMDVPAVVHSGRAPATSGYPLDPATICGVERTERVLRALPRLRLVVPHVGTDEVERHLELLDEHEHLYLDTTMTCSEYFDMPLDWAALGRRSRRLMYGSDFPIVPYAATRELEVLARRIPDDEDFERITRTTALSFWGEG